MKNLIIIVVAVLLTNVVTSQEKMYSFAYTTYVSVVYNDNYKVAYISPVVSITKAKYGDLYYVNLRGKWENKVKANVEMSVLPSSASSRWRDSYAKADEARDNKMIYYRRLGYEIITKTFGLRDEPWKDD